MVMTLERLTWPAPRALREPRRQHRFRAALPELAAVVALYACYSVARTLVPADAGTAGANADALLGLERALRMDVEASANGWLTARPTLALVAAYWYAALHYTVTPLLLLLLRRSAPRATYRRLRNALIAATMLAVAGYAAFPAMPPRLTAGFTDTLAATSGSGWWGAEASAPRGLGGLTNQFAAMPSMHVGWAVWCAVAIAALVATRRARALAWLYPLGTMYVVVATANHWVVDGLAGAGLVVAAVVVCRRL